MKIIDQRGADPWVIKDDDSQYVYIKTEGESPFYDSEILVGKSSTLEGIGMAAMRVVLSEQNLPQEASRQLWAPELHKLSDNRWYIYFAGSDGNNASHRMHVARSASDDPLGDYGYIGELKNENNKWAIDGTVLSHSGNDYFVWSGWPGDEDVQQNLYISGMSSPTTLDESVACISVPSLDWEISGRPINEGPAVLLHEDSVFLAYSASASWTDDYCIGLLELIGDDPLHPEAWKKHDMPLYTTRDDEFGPGHCSFTKDDAGNDIMVYHTARFSGSGWDRQVRSTPIQWEDGLPVVRESVGS